MAPARTNFVSRFQRDALVELLEEGWAKEKRCLAHNWSGHTWPAEAVWIRAWCDARRVNWGDPSGYPVQMAQRRETAARARSRIARWKEVRANGTISRLMFSLSNAHNPRAFARAEKFALAHGFTPHPFDPKEPC